MPLREREREPWRSYSSGSIPNLPSCILRVNFPSHSFFFLSISFSTDFAAYCFLFLSCCDLSIPAKYFDWSWIRTIHGTRLELGIFCTSSLQETFLSLTLKSVLVALEGHAAHFILWIRISIASLWKALSQTETLINL